MPDLSPQSDFSAIHDLLACPACNSPLLAQGDRLVCASCTRAYPVVNGIPVLIADRAERR